MKASGEQVVLFFKARELADLDVFSKSDPFVVAHTKVEGQDWVKAGQTEVVDNDLNPNFQQPVHLTYNFEKKQQLKLEVFDDDGGGYKELIGEAFSTLPELVACSGQTVVMQLKLPEVPGKPVDAKKAKRGTLTVRVMSFAEVEREKKPEVLPTFVDYIGSNWAISLMAAIDYTESNGLYKDPKSLHHIGVDDALGKAN